MLLCIAHVASSEPLVYWERCSIPSESALAFGNSSFGFRARFARNSPSPLSDGFALRRTQRHSEALPPASPSRPQSSALEGWISPRACFTPTSSFRLFLGIRRSARRSFSFLTHPLPPSAVLLPASLSQPYKSIEDLGLSDGR